jgi:hypothetical protein
MENLSIEILQNIVTIMNNLGDQAKGAFIAYLICALTIPPLLSAAVWIFGYYSLGKISHKVASSIWPKKEITPTPSLEQLAAQTENYKAETEAAKTRRQGVAGEKPMIITEGETGKVLEEICKILGTHYFSGNDKHYASDTIQALPSKIQKYKTFYDKKHN